MEVAAQEATWITSLQKQSPSKPQLILSTLSTRQVLPETPQKDPGQDVMLSPREDLEFSSMPETPSYESPKDTPSRWRFENRRRLFESLPPLDAILASMESTPNSLASGLTPVKTPTLFGGVNMSPPERFLGPFGHVPPSSLFQTPEQTPRNPPMTELKPSPHSIRLDPSTEGHFQEYRPIAPSQIHIGRGPPQAVNLSPVIGEMEESNLPSPFLSRVSELDTNFRDLLPKFIRPMALVSLNPDGKNQGKFFRPSDFSHHVSPDICAFFSCRIFSLLICLGILGSMGLGLYMLASSVGAIRLEQASRGLSGVCDLYQVESQTGWKGGAPW